MPGRPPLRTARALKGRASASESYQYLSSSFPSFANRGLKNRRSEVGADPGKRFCSKGSGRIDTSC